MKNFILMAVCVMALSIGTAGLTSCGSDDDGMEVVEEVVSGAHAILKNMQINNCVYFKKVGYDFSDVNTSGEPNTIDLFVSNGQDNGKEGCFVSCTIKKDYKTAYDFKRQFCENGRLTITSTGRKDEWGNDIKIANIYIPKMVDTKGGIVKELRLSYEGSMNESGMLEY